MKIKRRSRVGTGQKSVANVLEAVLARHKLTRGVRRARALVAWPEVVGPALARTTRAVELRDGVMLVETQDAVAANSLTMQRSMFLERLRAALGDDAPVELRFRMGVFERPAAARREPVRAPLPAPARERVEAMVGGVAEDILPAARRAAEAVARAQLDRAARGWPPCPVCGTPVERAGPCLPCRVLLANPHVRALQLRLAREPDLALLEPERLMPDGAEDAVRAARWLALEYLESQMESLLPMVVKAPRGRGRPRADADAGDAAASEHRAYLEAVARSFVALRAARPVAEVALPGEDAALLPERVRQVLSATGGR